MQDVLDMFELPLSTSLVVVAFPVFWVAYTAVFLWVSRNWDRTPKKPKDAS